MSVSCETVFHEIAYIFNTHILSRRYLEIEKISNINKYKK